MLNIAFVHAAHTPYVMEHYHHISLVSGHGLRLLTTKQIRIWYFITALFSKKKYIRHFEDIGSVDNTSLGCHHTFVVLMALAVRY